MEAAFLVHLVRRVGQQELATRLLGDLAKCTRFHSVRRGKTARAASSWQQEYTDASMEIKTKWDFRQAEKDLVALPGIEPGF